MTGTRTVLSMAVLAIVFSFTVLAQTPLNDVYQVNYFSFANECVFGTLRIVNPGTSGGTLCADIYVFTPDQQMAECCGCPITRNALVTLDIDGNLTSNPLTGVIPSTGAIKIVSSAGGSCNPSKLVPTPALRSWATHVQSFTGPLTEGESQAATLSSAEITFLENRCRAIQNNGSGQGICSCGGLTDAGPRPGCE